MKKIIIFFLCFNIMVLPAYCTISDNFIDRSLDKNIKIKTYNKINIKDDFVANTLDENLKIKDKNKTLIVDEFAEANTNRNAKVIKPEVIQEILPVVLENKTIIKRNVSNLDASTQVKVRIKKNFTTKQSIDEGDYIEFITVNDVIIKNKKYAAGTTVIARIENISLNKSMGVPADLVVGNFSIDGIPLLGEIDKTGANRSLWVYPCTYCLVCFFGVGLLFIPIRGGHAKIVTSEDYILYAE